MVKNNGSGPDPERGYKKPTLPTPWQRVEEEAEFRRMLDRMRLDEEEARVLHRIEFRNRAVYELGWSVFAMFIAVALCFLGEAHGWHF